MNETLRTYRSAPHSTTGKASAELLLHRNTLTRLPDAGVTIDREDDAAVRKKDEREKAKSAQRSDRRRRVSALKPLRVGDIVVAKQKRKSKWLTRFGKMRLKVTRVKGSLVSVRERQGREFTRDRTFFKLKANEIRERVRNDETQDSNANENRRRRWA